MWLGVGGEEAVAGGREERGVRVESEAETFSHQGEGSAHACPRVGARAGSSRLAWLALSRDVAARAWPPAPLPPPAKGRAILLPMDLDAHISSLLNSGASCAAAAQRNASNYKSATRAFPRVTPTANQWDYKNIIEKLQVGVGCLACWEGQHPVARD